MPMGNKPTHPETNLKKLAKLLLQKFSGEHRVTLIWCEGLPDYATRIRTFPLEKLPGLKKFVTRLATLYVPPLKAKN